MAPFHSSFHSGWVIGTSGLSAGPVTVTFVNMGGTARATKAMITAKAAVMGVTMSLTKPQKAQPKKAASKATTLTTRILLAG